MLKKILALFLAVVSVISLCACGGDSEDILILPIEFDPMCLDPQVADSKEAKLMIANCFEGLVRLDKDYKIVPGVAESWEISPDGLTYTFKLRSDTHWKLLNSFEDVLPEGYKKSYRTQVIAADFVFGLRRALDPSTQATEAEKLFSIKNASAVNSGKQPVSSLGIEARDDTTLVITLSRVDDDFLRLLTLPVAMPCHEDFFKATHAKYCLDLKYTFCNGPFYLSRWAEDNTLSMYKNDEYKGNAKVKPDEIYYYVNSDEASVVKKIRQRTYDCAFISENAKAELSDNDKLTNFSTENMIYGLCLNCSDEILSNETLRRVLAMITDLDELAANAGKTAASGIIPNCTRYGEKAYRDIIKCAVAPARSETLAFNLWKKELSKLNISTVEIVVTCTEEDAGLMQLMIQNWQRVLSTMILAKVEVKTPDQISTMIYNTSYQVLFHKISTDSSTVSDSLKIFTSDSDSNIFGFSDKEYDKIVDSVISTYSGDEKIKGCEKAENYIMAKSVFLPVYNGSSYAVVNKGVEGLYFSPAFESVCMISGGHV